MSAVIDLCCYAPSRQSPTGYQRFGTATLRSLSTVLSSPRASEQSDLCWYFADRSKIKRCAMPCALCPSQVSAASELYSGSF